MVASLIKKDPDSLRNLCNLSPQMAQLRDAFCTSCGISPADFIPLGLLIVFSLTLVAVFHTSSFIPNLARTFISFPESYHTPCRHTPSHKKVLVCMEMECHIPGRRLWRSSPGTLWQNQMLTGSWPPSLRRSSCASVGLAMADTPLIRSWNFCAGHSGDYYMPY